MAYKVETMAYKFMGFEETMAYKAAFYVYSAVLDSFLLCLCCVDLLQSVYHLTLKTLEATSNKSKLG